MTAAMLKLSPKLMIRIFLLRKDSLQFHSILISHMTIVFISFKRQATCVYQGKIRNESKSFSMSSVVRENRSSSISRSTGKMFPFSWNKWLPQDATVRLVRPPPPFQAQISPLKLLHLQNHTHAHSSSYQHTPRNVSLMKPNIKRQWWRISVRNVCVFVCVCGTLKLDTFFYVPFKIFNFHILPCSAWASRMSSSEWQRQRKFHYVPAHFSFFSRHARVRARRRWKLWCVNE